MPFELGLDHGAKRFNEGTLAAKSILVLEESRYDFQKSLSDISGWDIEFHNGDFQTAVRKVNAWFARHLGGQRTGTAKVLRDYQDFQEWHWERELALGASEDDIREYPTVDFVRAMRDWVELGRPT